MNINNLILILYEAKSCNLGKVHTECASSCPLTCANKNLQTKSCLADCTPGCECPTGYYIDMAKQGVCVKEIDCSCNYKDAIYNKNDIINVDCNTW